MAPPLVRPATPADVDLLHAMIGELAAYERLGHTVQAGPHDLAAALFADPPRAFATVVQLDDEPAGFCLWFYTYSTFVGRAGLYLEDLFVRPAFRGRGAARALLAALAQTCLEEGLGRLEWAVLDWNAPAIGFYDRIGAQAMDEWTVRRLSGPALAALAASGRNDDDRQP